MYQKNETGKDSDVLTIVGFKLGNEDFGINILSVNEILKMMEVTEIPNSANNIKGIVTIRDRLIPIIDTRKKLNLPNKENDSSTRIIVVEVNGQTVGFTVDKVNEVLQIPKSIIEPPPEMVTVNINTYFISSVAKLEGRILILLDLEKLILSKGLVVT